ncbi:MAG: ABC transporter permease [Oscillospiraceae bacterium]|nr:ABC transporter permease [Oscillospiraceae bacterium]
MGAIYRRELKAYFTSPIAYIYLAVFYLITGYYFCMANIYYATTDMSTTFAGIFTIMMILLPLLTMRLFADEKKQKTEQCLLTAPVNLFEIVMGKFLACSTIFLIGMAIYIPCVIVLVVLAGNISWAPIIGNMIGLLLLGMSFISIGIFFSSLTENQIVAAIISFLVIIFLYMIDVFALLFSGAISTVMASLGFYSRYIEFTQGILSINSIVFFISVIFVFNFLTVRMLEKRRWS